MTTIISTISTHNAILYFNDSEKKIFFSQATENTIIFGLPIFHDDCYNINFECHTPTQLSATDYDSNSESTSNKDNSDSDDSGSTDSDTVTEHIYNKRNSDFINFFEPTFGIKENQYFKDISGYFLSPNQLLVSIPNSDNRHVKIFLGAHIYKNKSWHMVRTYVDYDNCCIHLDTGNRIGLNMCFMAYESTFNSTKYNTVPLLRLPNFLFADLQVSKQTVETCNKIIDTVPISFEILKCTPDDVLIPKYLIPFFGKASVFIKIHSLKNINSNIMKLFVSWMMDIVLYNYIPTIESMIINDIINIDTYVRVSILLDIPFFINFFIKFRNFISYLKRKF